MHFFGPEPPVGRGPKDLSWLMNMDGKTVYSFNFYVNKYHLIIILYYLTNILGTNLSTENVWVL